MNHQAGATVEALTDREGKKAKTSMQEEEMLRHECLPLDDDDQYYEVHPSGSAHPRITEEAVQQAPFSRSVKKAQGLDKLSSGAILLLWKWDKEKIVRLTKAAIGTGRHPAVWNQARGVVIRNPGKVYHTQLKAYCSISLFACMGKGVEEIVDELLSDKAERR